MRMRALTAAVSTGIVAAGGYFFQTEEPTTKDSVPPQSVGVQTQTAETSPSADDPQFSTVRVFYGTDRARTGNSEPSEYYGAQRGYIDLGFCDVSIPKTHKIGHLEAPSIWKFEFQEIPTKHVVLMSVEPVDGPRFFTELRSTVQQSYDSQTDTGGEAFIFVHGFNVTFEDAARRTAQIAYDLQFRGAPILYSWPALGRNGLSAYRADGESAKWSEPNVTEFVASVARSCGARKIHVIAHSMGNRVVTGALSRMATDPSKADVPRLNEVILTAPDIDAKIFKQQIAPKIVQTADRITIYASSNDMALMASRFVNRLGDPRLGQGGSDLTLFPEYEQIEVVDASQVDTSLFRFGHSYHADNRSVLTDIRLVLDGRAAFERGLAAIRERMAWMMNDGHNTIGQRSKRVLR